MRQKMIVLLVVAGLLVVAAAGCGSTKTVTDKGANGQTTVQKVPNIHFAKTKFLLHAGLAFGAFHRYIYKPFKQGTFRKGASGRKKAFVKAGVAGLFAYHELKVARRDALASDTLRRHLIRPLDALGSKLKSLASSLKSGSLNPAEILGASGALDAVKSISGKNGASITERAAPILGG